MLKRALLVALALCLPLMVAGLKQPATAGSSYLELADLEGLPDIQEDSGRFLTVSGDKNRGIEVEPGDTLPPGEDPKQLVLRIFFTDSGSNEDVTIQIFDGDTKGLWDQRDDRPPVTPKGTTKPFDTLYELYEDKDGQVAQNFADGLAPGKAPLDSWNALGAPFAGTNAEWVELYSEGVTAGAQVSPTESRYSYTLRILLQKGPVAPLSGFEINGFKVAHNGRARLPEGTLLGIIGGAVDMRLGQGSAAGQLITEDPWLDFDNNDGAGGSEDWRNYNHPITGADLRNKYDGEWSFDFDGQDVCDLVLYETDADWNKPIPTPPEATTGDGTPYDPNPTGIPPDDGLIFDITPAAPLIVTNATFKIASPDSERHGLYWDILAPNGDIPYSSDDSPLGHPSYTGAQQFEWNKANLTAAQLADAGSFQPTEFDREEFRDPDRQSDTIPWKLRWHGVDARNAIWMRASGDFGTNGGREVSGYVFCDIDDDLEYDPLNPAPDTPVANAQVSITLFGSAPPQVTLATTNADGKWTASLMSGEYEIDLVDALLKAQAKITLPAKFDSCDGGIDIPLDCDEEPGSLSGRVWCDNNENREYDPPPGGIDKPLPQVIVRVEQPAGTLIKTGTTGIDGTYSVTGLAPGTYTVKVDTSTLPAAVVAISPETRVETVESGKNTPNVDFRYKCVGAISGHVYRELWECDGKLSVDEKGIENVEVKLYNSDVTPRLLVATETTNAAGFFEFEPLLPGSYDIVVDETQTAVSRLKASFPVPAERKDVSVSIGQEVKDQDFFFCPGALKVRVFKKARGKACENKIEEGDTPLPNAAVKVTDITPIVGGAVYNGTTNAQGEVLFRNLDAGTYRVEVNGNLLTLYVPAPGAASQEVEVEAGKLTVADSVWCDKSCCVCGEVVRKKDCVDWWFARHGEGIDGVWVDLRKGNDPDLLTDPIESMQTKNGGFFSFQTVAGGEYTVSIRRPQGLTPDPLEDLTPTTPEVVYVEECPQVVRFVYATAAVWTKVVLDTNCDGISERGVPGVKVTLTKLDAPKKDVVWTSTTNGAGEVRFPTAAMNGLLPGRYTVSISPIPGLIPQGPLTKEVALRICRPARVTFRFCGVGMIEGYVFKEIVDCNGEQVPGEPGVNGVRVELYDATGTTFLRATTTAPHPVTNRDGYYKFGNLPRGTYVVKVPNSSFPANTSPSTPTTVRRTVIPPRTVRLDFGFCPNACLFGYVFKQDPGEDCDGTYDPRVDEPISGVVVTLVRVVDGPRVPAPMYRTTNDQGYYEFCDLAPGRYIVSVSRAQPMLITLSPSTALEVGPLTLRSGERKRVDFGFCKQEIHGTVFREPEGNCNGIYDRGDTGIEGVRVKLTKLDEPGRGRSRETLTNGSGDYWFRNIPAGRYEISIPTLPGGAPQTVLVGLNPSSPQPLTPTLLPGQILEDQDFGYCPIPKGKICGRVWKNPWDKDCDRTYDRGDVPLAKVTVTLSRVGLVGIKSTLTDSEGRYCFKDLPAGRYIVAVPGFEPVFLNIYPNGPTSVTVDLPPGGERTVNFPYCEKCPENPCCKGNMHEVVVVTKFWVDRWEKWYDVYATFYDDCACPPHREIDFAGLWYKGDFPGATTGYNEVITIEDVEIEGNWAIVKLRLTAQGCWFPRGFFGHKCRSLVVEFNGRKAVGKTIFRCEYVRPGSWFTSSDDCPFPECPEDGQYPEVDPYLILKGPPGKCPARFLVLDTYDWESWYRCNPKRCKRQSETCKCGYNLVELELDYWVSHRGPNHRFLLELSKAGKDVIDGFKLDFQGDSWEGEKTGWGHYATLKKVKLVKKGQYTDLWRATLLIRACDRKDGNPRALPSQLNVGTTLDDWAHDYWLDLSYQGYYSRHCLEVGRIMSGGNFTGVSILRWLSVEDAAWCPAYRCPPKVCGDKPCAPREEDLLSCGCEQK